MKVLLIALLPLCCYSAFGACTVLVTAPNASANIAGYKFNLTAANSDCITPVYSEDFLVDGERAGIEIISSAEAVTALGWNTYNVDNGNHSVQVVARDILGNILATSAAVAFSVWNFLPQNTCSYSDSPSSACSGLTVTTGPSTFFPLGAQPFGLSSISFKSSSGGIVQSASAGIGASSVTLSGVVSGHAIAVYVSWLSTSSSVTVNDGSAYTCPAGTKQAFNSNESVQWCYLLNAGSGTHTISVSTGAGQIRGIQAKELSGVPISNGVDIAHAVAGTSGQSQFDGPFALSQTDEIVLGGISYNAAPTIVSIPGYVSVLQDPDRQTTTEALITSGTNWSGAWAVSYAVTGANATQTKTVTLAVDGFKVADNNAAMVGPLPNTTSATGTILVPTARFLSGAQHSVVLEARNTDNSSGIGSLGFWGSFGGWEAPATFSNPATPMELRSSARDQVILCGSFPCANTVPLTANLVNSDGSVTAATISSCTSSNTAVFTKSGTCTVNPVGYGSAYMNITDSQGLTRRSWVFVRATNTLPHFALNGARLNAYSAGNSILFHDIFLTSFARISGPVTAYLNPNGTLTGITGIANTLWGTQFATAYKAAGFQAVESSFPGVSFSDTESSYETRASTWTTNLCAALPAGIRAFGQLGGSFFTTGVDLDPGYFSFYNPGGSFPNTKPMQYMTQQLTSRCGIMMEGPDEWTPIAGNQPTADITTAMGVPIGTHGYTSIGVTSGSNIATLNGTAYSFNGPGTFAVQNTGNAALDYTAGRALFTAPGTAGTPPFTFTAFSNAAGNATLTTGNILTFSENVYDTTTGLHCQNTVNIHCTGFIYNNWLNLSHNQIGAVANHIGIAFPPRASDIQNNPGPSMNWCKPDVAEFCDVYPPSAIAQNYLPLYMALSTINGDDGSGDWVRTAYGYIPESMPMLTLVGALMTNYVPHGYPVTLVSMSGNTLTFTGDHGQRNVFPGSTRLSVCAAPPCRTAAGTVSYYVLSWPTSTTATLALADDTGSSPSGTLTFDDGHTCTSANFNTGGGGALAGDIAFGTCSAGNIVNERGHAFTIAGDARTFVLMLDTLDAANNVIGGSVRARQLPALSCASSCGAAYIIPDNQIHVGGGSYRPSQENGPRQSFAQEMYFFSSNKSSGHRQYGPDGADHQVFDRTLSVTGTTGWNTGTFQMNGVYQSNILQEVQPGNDPVFNDGRSFQAWQSLGLANLMESRLAPYALQAQLNSPDCGRFFECSVRQDANGNTLLMVQSLADWPLAFTSTLTPYLIAGQGVLRECADWRDIAPLATLPAATNTDSYAYPPGGFCAYIFDHAASGVADQRTISFRLDEVTGAAGRAIEWTQGPALGNGVPYAFTDQTDMIPNIVDCGSAGSCTIPADRTIGPISWRLVYYDANKRPLTIRGSISTL